MKQSATTYVGYFWSPSAKEGQIREALSDYGATDIKRFEDHTIKPPTFIKVNDFTYAFQEIVNTYGVPMYKEANPAVTTAITFPFLFGVMFGDIGHGGLLMIVGILLCIFNDKIKKTPLAAASSVRYLLLLMGLFGFYNGWIYNEFFAIPLEVFGSCYSEQPSRIETINYSYGFNRTMIDGEYCVYPFGVDPRWFQST